MSHHLHLCMALGKGGGILTFLVERSIFGGGGVKIGEHVCKAPPIYPYPNISLSLRLSGFSPETFRNLNKVIGYTYLVVIDEKRWDSIPVLLGVQTCRRASFIQHKISSRIPATSIDLRRMSSCNPETAISWLSVESKAFTTPSIENSKVKCLGGSKSFFVALEMIWCEQGSRITTFDCHHAIIKGKWIYIYIHPGKFT